MKTHLIFIIFVVVISVVYPQKKNQKAISPEMIKVEGGMFKMGSKDGDSDEEPVHEVTVNSFLIGKYEVTQELWKSVTGNNPSNWIGDKGPVESVTFYEVIEFCNKLSEKEGLKKAYSGIGDNISCDFTVNGYRLPTEAEWEYAARGGKKSKSFKYSGSNSIDAVAWYKSNSLGSTHIVGTKIPNELELCDMSGNVVEWCWDWYGDYAVGSQTNTKGLNVGDRRVLRGGCWGYEAERCRVTSRKHNAPGDRYCFIGFRLARTK